MSLKRSKKGYTTHTRTTDFAVQGKRGPGEFEGTTKYTCSLCMIDYHVVEGNHAVCPLCDANREMEALREQLHSTSQQVGLLQSDLRRARAEADLVTAMRESLDLTDSQDMAEMKAIAYRWRANPDKVVVQYTTPKVGRFADGSDIALTVHLREGQRKHEVFVPSSIGGVAFARFYADLCRARGNVQAMNGYTQAMAKQLTP